MGVGGLPEMETTEGLFSGGRTVTTTGDVIDLPNDNTLLPEVDERGVNGVNGVVGVVGADPDDVVFGIMSFKTTCFDVDGAVNKGL